MASRSNTVMAPCAPRSRARTGFWVPCLSDHDIAKALFQIGKRYRKTQNGHDLGGDNDVKAVLARITVGRAAQAADDRAQRPIVHVHDTPPGDASHIDTQLVAMVNMVVDHCRQQIVGQRDRVEVAGEVQVDVLHRNNLGVTAACGAALDAKHGSQRRFTQGDDSPLADSIQRITQAYRGGGFALACRGRADRRDQDQFAIGSRMDRLQIIQRQLGFEVPIGFERFGRNAERSLANSMMGRIVAAWAIAISDFIAMGSGSSN